MLTLSREMGQALVIGDRVLLTVLEIEGQRVRVRLSRTMAGARISWDEVVRETWVAVGEELQVEAGVGCTVMLIAGAKVRWGIRAPEGCEVQRKEVYERIKGMV